MDAVEEKLSQVPEATRPLVAAAVATIRAEAPGAETVVYRGGPPSSPTYMWKLVRFRAGGRDVAGVGTFSEHAALFLYEGRSLPDPTGRLNGSGRDARFIRLLSVDDATASDVRALIAEAFRRPPK